MRPTEKIKRMFEKADVTVDSKVNEKIIANATAAFEKNRNTQAAEKPRVWGMIMKSKITKLAVAAGIIIAMLIGLHYFGGSIDGASVAWGQIAENMKKMPWMHQITKGVENGLTGTSEHWVAFESKIWIWKNADGAITYQDYAKKEQFIYNPSSQIVTISYLNVAAPELSSAGSLVDFIIKEANEQNAKIVQKTGTYKNKPSEIIEVQLQTSNAKCSGQLFVDIHSHLITGGTINATDLEGKTISNAEFEIEYPNKGPSSIFDLGVPETAKTINTLPTPQVSEVLKEYQSHRENELRKYAAVAIEDTSAEIMYRDGELSRTERRYPKNKMDWVEHSADLLTNFDLLIQWWSNDNNTKMAEVYIYDGKYDYYVYGLPDNPKGYHYKGHNPNHRTLSDFGWPNISQWISPNRDLKIIETDYSKANGLICMELLCPGEINGSYICLPRRNLYYLDPNKDYICVRSESYLTRNASWQDDKTWLTNFDSSKIPPDSYQFDEVMESRQTDNGMWYPKIIKATWCGESTGGKEDSCTRNIYLTTNPIFLEGLFNPENLPKHSE